MIRNYLTVAFRNLKRHRGYAAINIGGLAVGLACALLIVLYVNDELSYDRYHVNKDSIFRVVTGSDSGTFEEIAKVAGPWGPAIAEQTAGVSEYVRFRFANTVLMSGNGKQFYESEGLYADDSVFEVFSYEIVDGSRDPLVDPGSIVVTESFAARYYGDATAIGESIEIGTRLVNITAVIRDIPDNSHFRFDYLLPTVSEPDSIRFDPVRNQHYTYLLLDKGVLPETVEAGLTPAIASLVGDEAASGYRPRLQAITDIHLHSNLFREMEPNGNTAYIYIFSLVAGLVLLLACINFINLSTARSVRRAREVGVRKASGARRGTLVFQFLSESLILSLLAVVAGIILISILLPSFNTISGKSLTMNVFLETNMIVGIGLLTIITTVLAGLYPAFVLSAFQPAIVLKGEATRLKGARLRKGLVIFQFAISVFLIGSVGIVNKQMSFIQNTDLGFERDQLLVIPIRDDAIRLNTETFKSEVLNVPGVVSATASGNLPGGGDYGFPLFPQDIADDDRPRPRILVTDDTFVETYKMRLSDGRSFSRADADAGGAFMVNETMAGQLREAGWESIVGKSMGLPPSISEQQLPVVGVVEDFHFRSLHEEIGPLVFFMPPPEWFSVVTLRIAGSDARQTIAQIADVWRGFDNQNPMTSYFLDDNFQALYQSETTVKELLGYATILAILVACMGLFGLAAFTAEQRTKEIGIRKILGASVGGVVLLLTKDYATLVLAALAIAMPVAYFAGGRWLENFAYRVSPDLSLVALSGLAALAIALATVSYQSLKAALADPVKSLRYE
ncbi:MAG: FtsX-like permease family protein [Rhodothermales bacterium]|nr:FtsX-like permease family protein [Rhodothermales bacterium]